jgi:hypothetical protein
LPLSQLLTVVDPLGEVDEAALQDDPEGRERFGISR